MSDSVTHTEGSMPHGPTLPNTSNLPAFSNTGWNGNILLFFVALGFGILFCNLWVIIGIKYCYRYSNVNRSETIEIERVAPRTQDCQKKLMTQGEADQQFPSILYKVWRSQHKHGKQCFHETKTIEESKEQELVDTVAVINSDNVPDISNEHKSQQELHDSNILYNNNLAEKDINTSIPGSYTNSLSNASKKSFNSNTENNDVNIYIPDEQSKHGDEYVNENKHKEISSVNSSNDSSYDDTCAICLDVFEGEDEVRVLTCGHIYHSSCIVPWFTTRRAMCPLCKYDFYIPKVPTSMDTENTSRNIESFRDHQIYDHHRHRPPMVYFSTFEPQHYEQYRFSNNYGNNLYRETNARNPLSRGIHRSLLFRRNHSFI
ncbi:hypothetical protein PMAC_002471 [Pneumocystis sp. 'macacae']|nr:hypothetical protein PMAC_002471 [Pneumocystis sp. 'macacae']